MKISVKSVFSHIQCYYNTIRVEKMGLTLLAHPVYVALPGNDDDAIIAQTLSKCKHHGERFAGVGGFRHCHGARRRAMF